MFVTGNDTVAIAKIVAGVAREKIFRDFIIETQTL
jgi:hypothetical protein